MTTPSKPDCFNCHTIAPARDTLGRCVICGAMFSRFDAATYNTILSNVMGIDEDGHPIRENGEKENEP